MIVSLPDERRQIDEHNAPIEASIAEKKVQIDKLLDPARARLVAARQAEMSADVLELLKTPEADRTADVKEKLKPFEAESPRFRRGRGGRAR